METNTTPRNSQEMNESQDRLHPDYGQYVLVNTEKGSVVWYETYDQAVRNQAIYGGNIINTATADPAVVARILANARHSMDAKPNQDSRSRLALNTPTDAKANPTA